MRAFPFSVAAALGYNLFESKFQMKVAEKHQKHSFYEEPFSIESLKESAIKVWFEDFCCVSENINQN